MLRGNVAALAGVFLTAQARADGGDGVAQTVQSHVEDSMERWKPTGLAIVVLTFDVTQFGEPVAAQLSLSTSSAGVDLLKAVNLPGVAKDPQNLVLCATRVAVGNDTREIATACLPDGLV